MDEAKYYAMIGSERVGPMSLDELRNIGLTPQTPVWHPGMADWANASTLPELASMFVPAAPQYPPYAPAAPQPAPGYQQPAYQQQGYQQPSNGLPPRPDNYLVWAIIVTVCCCLVGGIVALIYSSKVNQLYDAGDYEGAVSASKTTKNWCIWSAVISAIGSILYIILILVGAFADIMF